MGISWLGDYNWVTTTDDTLSFVSFWFDWRCVDGYILQGDCLFTAFFWSFIKTFIIYLFILPFVKKFEDITSFSEATDTPILDFLVMSDLGFKARWIPLLACFIACVKQNPQIHLWCNTYWPAGS